MPFGRNRQNRRNVAPQEMQLPYQADVPNITAELVDIWEQDQTFLRSERDKALFWSDCKISPADSVIYWKRKPSFVLSEVVVRKTAELIGAKTISYYTDQTDGGYVEDRELWNRLSKIFAERASGVVHVITGDGVKDTSIWLTIEFPALIENNDVTKIVELNAKNPEWKRKEIYLRGEIPNDIIQLNQNARMPFKVEYEERNRNPVVILMNKNMIM